MRTRRGAFVLAGLWAIAGTSCAALGYGPHEKMQACTCGGHLDTTHLAIETGAGLPPRPTLSSTTVSLGAVDTPSASAAPGNANAATAPPTAIGGGPQPAEGPTVRILSTEGAGPTVGDMGTGTTETIVGPAGAVAPSQVQGGVAPAR